MLFEGDYVHSEEIKDYSLRNTQITHNQQGTQGWKGTPIFLTEQEGVYLGLTNEDTFKVVSVDGANESSVVTYSDDKEIFSYLINVTLSHIERKAKGIRLSGGFVNGKPTEKSIFLHIKSHNSRFVSPLPIPLVGHSIVKLGKEKKYLFGGLTTIGDSSDLTLNPSVFLLVAKKWQPQRRTFLFPPSSAFHAHTTNGELHGGMIGNGAVSNALWENSGEEWKLVEGYGKAPALFLHTGALIGGSINKPARLFLAGGNFSDGSPNFSTLFGFDFYTKSWIVIDLSLPPLHSTPFFPKYDSFSSLAPQLGIVDCLVTEKELVYLLISDQNGECKVEMIDVDYNGGACWLNLDINFFTNFAFPVENMRTHRLIDSSGISEKFYGEYDGESVVIKKWTLQSSSSSTTTTSTSTSTSTLFPSPPSSPSLSTTSSALSSSVSSLSSLSSFSSFSSLSSTSSTSSSSPSFFSKAAFSWVDYLDDFYRELTSVNIKCQTQFTRPPLVCANPPNVSIIFQDHISLLDRISISPLSLSDTLRFSLSLAISIMRLSDNGIVHGDLQLVKCLVDECDRLVLTDFGFMQKTTSINKPSFYAPHGAPELWLKMEDSFQGEFNLVKTEIFAFGFTVWQMLTNCSISHPFTPGQEKEEILSGKRPEIPENTPTKLRSLIELCWHQDYNQRPDIQYLVAELKELSRHDVRHYDLFQSNFSNWMCSKCYKIICGSVFACIQKGCKKGFCRLTYMLLKITDCSKAYLFSQRYHLVPKKEKNKKFRCSNCNLDLNSGVYYRCAMCSPTIYLCYDCELDSLHKIKSPLSKGEAHIYHPLFLLSSQNVYSKFSVVSEISHQIRLPSSRSRTLDLFDDDVEVLQITQELDDDLIWEDDCKFVTSSSSSEENVEEKKKVVKKSPNNKDKSRKGKS